MPLFPEGIAGVLQQIIEFLGEWWWVIAPPVLLFIAVDLWLQYIRGKYVAELDWRTLQLVVPQEVTKTPLAMEQIFANLHSAFSKGSWFDKYIKGKVQEWFSFEIRSMGGKIYFYIHTPNKHRALVESSIYAQYPEAEIYEATDYSREYPEELPNPDYDLAGAEFILEKENAYPIRTYPDFVFETEEQKRPANVDPLAGIIEALSQLRDGEEFWLQLAIKPINDDWKKEGEDVIGKLMGHDVKDEKKKSVLIETLSKEVRDYATGFSQAPFKVPEYDTDSAKEEKPSGPTPQLSPRDRLIAEVVGQKISKLGFETTLRALYLARRDIFNKEAFGTVTATFRQYSSIVNGIKSNGDTATKGKWPFKEAKARFRKRAIIKKYRDRSKPAKSFIFNTEELATLYHFPGRVVTAPALSRIETKKGEPPPGLPMSP